jgi:very-short-patch-repair endonuclease
MPDPRLTEFARSMRKSPSDAERTIWSIMRGKQLHGHKFRRQHVLAGYIADFYCHEARLVIELDGRQHAQPDAAWYDEQRTKVLESMGIRVTRFSSQDALKRTDAVARAILDEVERRVGAAPTQPPPRAGEVSEGLPQ